MCQPGGMEERVRNWTEEPYIHMSEDEDKAVAICRCRLEMDSLGCMMFFQCPMHQNAGEMLVALERVEEALKDYYAGKSDWDTALERTVSEVVSRAKENA